MYMNEENRILITNNSKVSNKFSEYLVLEFIDGSILDVFIYVRNLIHKGYRLLTHPLSGSVKPNENPYKSVILEKGCKLDLDSLSIIENAILTVNKFGVVVIEKESHKKDGMLIDLTLIESAIK